MGQTLRPYQSECVHAVFDAIDDGFTRILYTMATGLGKTTTFAELSRIFLEYYRYKVLILAHRRELIIQAFQRVREHCGLDEWGIGIDMAETVANPSNKVVVANIATVRNAARLPDWCPDVIITDECHRAAAKSYQAVYERFGVPEGKCLSIGCTATAKRTDKQALVAIGIDGQPVLLFDKKKKQKFPADPAQTVYQKHVYECSILDGVEGGWLVPIKGHVVKTETDLSEVETDADGDFKEGQLQKAVDNQKRTLLAINAWRQIARERPTLVFCAGVEHAYHAAQLWEQAGYKAAALDGTVDSYTRGKTLEDFRAGRLHILCNMGLFTEGTDLPSCAAIVHLRPTKSWNLYVQMCVDMQTEILTDQGWRTAETIQPTDRAAGFDMATGQIRWNTIREIINRPLSDADEGMYAYSSPCLDYRVTGGHNMVYRTRKGRKRTPSAWSKIKAEDLAERTYDYQIPVAGLQDAPGVPLTDDELRFIGWFLTDGTLNRKNNSISICQAEHQPYHQAIIQCLKGCGFKYGVYRTDTRSQFQRTSALIRYTVSKGQPRGRDADLRGWSALEPFIDKDFSPCLEDCTPAQLAVLIEAMNMGDGVKYHGKDWKQRTFRICTGRKIVADRLQSLCIRRGFRCNQSIHFFNQNPIYYLSIKPEVFRTVGGASSTDRASLCACPFNPSERVWCLETEMGTIITRRNGKVTIMGNTGRGTRTLPGVIDGIDAPGERVAAIAGSGKPDCLVIDLVDICEGNDLCSVPSILDLPMQLDLEGQSVTAAKRLLDEFEQVKAQVVGECPTTFRELQVRLAQVALLRNSTAKTAKDWLVTDNGFRYHHLPPGYSAELTSVGSNEYELKVSHRNQVLFQKTGKAREQFRTYLAYAAGYANAVVKEHKASLPAESRGTLGRLTVKQARILKINGHTEREIDCMPYAKAKALIDKYMAAWKARQEQTQKTVNA